MDRRGRRLEFSLPAEFLDAMPAQYGGSVGGRAVGHARTPPLYRARSRAVVQLGGDTFRVLRPVAGLGRRGEHRGRAPRRRPVPRDQHRWGSISLPTRQGAASTYRLPCLLPTSSCMLPDVLDAKASSGLPVYFEVDLRAGDHPGTVSWRFPSFPWGETSRWIQCSVTAYQIGRRTQPAIPPAPPGDPDVPRQPHVNGTNPRREPHEPRVHRIRVVAGDSLVPCASPGRGSPAEAGDCHIAGNQENDDIEGVAAGGDGSIYIAGNTGKPVASLPGGARLVTLGEPAKEPRCGCGFVARLSPDAKKILDYVQFAPGVALLTTVEVNRQGVYAGGYASAALEPLVKDLPGLMRQYPLAREVELIRAGRLPRPTGFPTARTRWPIAPGWAVTAHRAC